MRSRKTIIDELKKAWTARGGGQPMSPYDLPVEYELLFDIRDLLKEISESVVK